MKEKIKSLLDNRRFRKSAVIILRDLIMVIALAVTCFLICRYNNVRMCLMDGKKALKCDLNENDKTVVLNLIDIFKENGEVVKRELNNASSVVVKYKNKSYRVADGFLEEKGLLSKKVYCLITDEFDNTEVFDSIADRYYPLQAYFTDPDSGFSFITIKKGSVYYRFSNEDDLKYNEKSITEALAEYIKPMLMKPAPYDPNGVKVQYVIDVNTKHTVHRIEVANDRITVDRDFYYNGAEELTNLLDYLTSHDENAVEMNYWDFTKRIGY